MFCCCCIALDFVNFYHQVPLVLNVTMKKYAVAHMNFLDNDLKIKIVGASDWREALIRAFPIMGWIGSDNLERSKSIAFGSDVLFDVVEIP